MLSSEGQEEKIYIKAAERVEGCELISITHPKDEKNDTYYLDFNFRQKSNGGTFRHRVFDLTRQGGNISDEQFKKFQGWGMGSLKHIVQAFVELEGELTAPDWKGLIKVIKQKLGVGEGLTPKFKGVECALKITVKGKFSQFPLFPPFISTERQIRDFTSSEYDNYTIEGVSSTSSAAPATSNDDDGDDPFAEDVLSSATEEVTPETNSVEDDF
jgi:hypothetical protein